MIFDALNQLQEQQAAQDKEVATLALLADQLIVQYNTLPDGTEQELLEWWREARKRRNIQTSEQVQ